MKRVTIVGLIIVLAATSISFAKQPEYRPGVMLVRFADASATTTDKNNKVNAALGVAGANIQRNYSLVPGLSLVNLPAGTSVESAAVALKKSPSILYAEPDYKLELLAVPNDARFSELWGMTKIGAPAAWDISTGSSSIIVAVTDTGVDYTHLDLAANMWHNPNEIPGNGIDDDGNGYIDDVYGIDTGDNDGNPMDDSAIASHGTHVAGTIGAVGNNGTGVTGVCWNVKIMAIKLSDSNGGPEEWEAFVSNAVAGIQYAKNKGAKVINASWRAYEYSQNLYDAIAAARDAGMIFVAAAGNESINNDSMPAYPASYDLTNIISVMATTNTDARAVFSNYGLTTVDLGAPGDNILSTIPGNQYEYSAGTSMAAPHVAGACALLLSIDPTLTYWQVKQILLDTVDETLPGLCVSGGRMNLAAAAAEAAVDTTPPTPNPPQWATGAAPKATGLHTVIMRASAVTDRSGVEYYFECINDVSKNSGWTANTQYSFTTLNPNTTYGFHFKARDKSDGYNETDWSVTGFVTTSDTVDDKPPFPDPPQWLKLPVANPQFHQIRMIADIGYDESGPIEYQFQYQYSSNPAVDVNWQSSNIYIFAPPPSEPNTTVYNFRFHVRDAYGNETDEWSPLASARMYPYSRILKVPSAEFLTIQDAVDASVDGDTVVVSPYPYPPYYYRGVYGILGNTGNINIRFNGRAITVKSENPSNPDVVARTIIDCEGTNDPCNPRRAFIFDDGEGPSSVVAGFTIRNAYVKGHDGNSPADAAPDVNGGPGYTGVGGAILCGPSPDPCRVIGLPNWGTGTASPTIRNCVFLNCIVEGGDGGLGADGNDGNDANSEDVPPTPAQPGQAGGHGGDSGAAFGGAIYCSPGSNPAILNCSFNKCRAIAGVPGNAGNGGEGGNDPNLGPAPGGNGGNGGDIDYIAGGAIFASFNSNPEITGCYINDCNAIITVPQAVGGQPGVGGVPGYLGGWSIALGGGVFYTTLNSPVNISSTVFSGNMVDDFTHPNYNFFIDAYGGGIFLDIWGTGDITLSDCNFSGNFAGTDGGGIASSGYTHIVLRNCRITDNNAVLDGGGLVSYGGALDIYDSEFTGNNRAAYGGAMYLFYNILTILNSDFQGNRAQEGGAIGAIDCNVGITDCRIINNSAFDPTGGNTGIGGGLVFWNTYGKITNCMLGSNSADDSGGAAFVAGWTTMPMQFINCLITDNTAYYNGGGIFANMSGWARIYNSTFVNNYTESSLYGSGGAVDSAENFAWVVLYNSILWDNSSANGSQIAVGTALGSSQFESDPFADVDVTNCDVEGGQDELFIEDPVYNWVWWLAGNISDDPLFVDVDVNEPGYYLSQVKAGQSVNSPCVDAGSFTASDLQYLVGRELTTRTDLVEDANTVDIGYHYIAGVAKQYNLTIDVYKFDPNEGGHGRLTAQSQDGSDYHFNIQDTNTIQISQATQVELIAAPDPCFKVQYWSGTDNDGQTALINTVTMNDDKRVVVAFAPDGWYYLTVSIVSGEGNVTPLGRTLHRPGEVVTLTAVPTNPLDKIDWTGTDNDASETQINTITMTAHKDVTVEFYTPRILHVGGDMNYPNIQMAIDAAQDRDIVLITPGTYNIVQSSQDNPYLLIDGKDITVTTTSPENPELTVITGKFMIYNVSRKCVIQGLTISGNVYWGNEFFTSSDANVFQGDPTDAGADGPYPGDTPGAGMTLNGAASPTVRNVNFISCRAMGIHGSDGAGGADPLIPGTTGNGGPGGRAMGGGAYCGPNGSPLFFNCLFTGCLARGGDAGNGAAAPAPGALPGHGGAWGDKDGYWWDYGLMDYWRYSGFGGAVYCDEGSTAEFINCNFIDNTTIGGSCGISGSPPVVMGWPYSHYKIQSFGGAVYAATGSAPTFTDCNFTDNMADPNGWPVNENGGGDTATVAAYLITSYGGAIAFETGASPLFTECTFTANLAAAGGAVYCDESYPEFEESAFISNSALHGGGLMFSQGYSIINRCYFTGNEGTYQAAQGGAISALGANGEITDCNINGNRSAGSGGGIYVSSRNIDGTEAPGGNSVLIKNCLIINNAADLGGGGVAAVWYSDPNIVNCTIANNTTGEGALGGGLLVSYGSFANVINTIIWGNMGDTAGTQLALSSGLPIAPTPSTANVSYSVIGPLSNNDEVAVEPAPALTIDVNNNANTLVNAILGPGIELEGAATYTGADAASGIFSGGLAAGIGIESGIIMTCGLATNALPPNNDNAITFDNGMPGDPDLLALLQAADPEATDLVTNNASVLEFTFTSRGGNLFFNFVFASEEYFEFVNTQFNDIFAFFLDGTNIALIPGTTRPVSINNVNGGNPIGTDASNPQLYKSNDPCQAGGAPFAIQYDGFTNVFTARALNVGSGTHTIKIAIADAGDSALDSAVFIEAGSFSDTPLYSEPIFVDVCSVLSGWDSNAADPNNPWAPSTHNLRIDSDPCFVSGAGYFLSQIAAGQLFTSPCVDAGSADADTPGIDLANYTTRTDSVGDQGIVDMGYHYPFFTPPQYWLDFSAVVGNGLEANDIEPNSGLFNWFTNVPLRVNRDPGSFQVLWTGTDNDDINDVNNIVLMDGPKTVTVEFVSNTCVLTTEVIGGHGTISVSPEGPVYPRNSVVTLTAIPEAGYRIKAWTGTDNDIDYFGFTNTVTMAGDKHVTVEFQVPQIITVPGDFTTIQGAVNAARPGDIVSLASGVYNTPNLEINKEITITSTNPDDPCVVAMTVIDGSGIASTGVIFYAGATGQTVLNGITIANCGYGQIDRDDADAVGEPGPDGYGSEGGGIYIDSGASPTIKNCIIRNCNITGGNAGNGGNSDATTDAGHGGWAGWARGAGVYVSQYANPTFINCTISDNTATGGNGGDGGNFTEDGGDAGYGGNWSDGLLWQTWGYIGDYRFYSGYGAGVFCDVNSSATFIACSIINNTASGGMSGIGGNRAQGVQIPMPDTAYRLPGYGGGVYCGENSSIEFVDCNITGNLAPKPDATYHTDPYLGHGGGIAFENTAFVSLTGCNISDNISAVGGGMFWSGSAPMLSDCNISANIAYIGGGIYGQDGVVLVEDCDIYDNFAGILPDDVDVIAGQGGGIFSESMDADIINSSFVNNTAGASGAGIYFHGPVEGGDNMADINNCLMAGNAAGRDGGGISANWNVSINVANCTLLSNSATGSLGKTALGGGLYCDYGAKAKINDCNISNNRSAGDGGGIYLSGGDVGGDGGIYFLVKNCLIINNSASLDGGGVAAAWYSDPNIINCTIAKNTAGGIGGGVSSSYGSFVNLVNNIIWDNVGSIGANGSQLGVSVAPSNMLVRNSDVQGATDPNQFGRDIRALDLVFCIDTTGSMADDIAAVKTAAGQIINAIGTQFPDYRVAEVNYNDFYDDLNTAAPYGSPGDRPYTDAVRFTTDVNLLIAGLQPMTAGGGADGPESVYAALMHCIDANALEARLNANGNARFIDVCSPGVGAWREGRDVLRVVMLMGDAPPHDPEPYTNYTLNDIVTAASGLNPVHVVPILIGSDTYATESFISIATATGGTVVQAAEANAVVGAVLQAVDLMKHIPNPVFVDFNGVLNWDPCTMQWEPGSGNINADPCFVNGADYFFLSQIAAGQLFTSPCVDAGSANANAPGIDLANYTTRTDSVGDLGIVDMGYHYPLFTPPQYQLVFNAVVANGLEQSDLEPNGGLFNWFTDVQLRVNRDPGSFHVLWTGTDNDDANGTTNTLRMDGPRTVTVAFVSNTFILTAEVLGGHGTISPIGGTYPRNSVVTLTATPDAGYRIKRWTGTNNDGSYSLTNSVTMTGDKNVTVEFEVPSIRTVPGDFTTIQGAVDAARPGDIVSVASGVYQSSAILINKEVTLTSTNPDDPCVAALTIIDSSGFASPAIIFSGGATANTVLNGFTITGGTWFVVDAAGDVAAGQNGIDGGSATGGAVYIGAGASPTIKNCVIRDTTITGGNATDGGNADATVAAGRGGWPGGAYGGGVYVSGFANPTFINCTIRNCNVNGGNAGNGGNSSGNIFGAADYRDANYGGSFSNPFQGVGANRLIPPQPWWLMRNSSGQPYRGDYGFYSGLGGGVFCDINSSATFISCNILNNDARGGMSGVGGTRPQGIVSADPVTAYRIPSYGGGVYCGENSSIEFVDCNITSNLAPKPDATYHTDPYLGHGGGIAFENTAFVSLTGCNISYNISAVGGGMFWLNSVPVIRDCNISANIAYVGGGIYCQDGAPLIEDCNILRNFAGISAGDVDLVAGQGGGIFCESVDADIIDSRFVDNTAGASGAGIYFHGPVSGGDNTANVTNCLMTGNTAGRDGGGISANWNISVDIANCTLHSNNATGDFGDPDGHTGLGGGLYCAYGAITNVIDSIIWRNDANFGPEIAVDTGFELDQHCGSVSVSYSDVRGGSAGAYIGEAGNCSANLTWGVGNIGADPRFVSEIISDYHLQQITAGQTVTSPCVGRGSTSAVNAGLALYTTRFDEVPDRGIVDMGYHYLVEQPCRFVDIGNKILTGDRDRWMKDGIIDWTDFVVLADFWLSSNCSAIPTSSWCKGADLTFDGLVNWEDLALVAQCWLASDMTAPSPSPSQWRIYPTSVWPDKVKMAAVDSIDRLWGLKFDTTHPVQYQFQCTSGNGHDRDWGYDANYTDTGLQSYTEYAYRVRARDLVGNMTEWSSVQWTVISPDSVPPTPNPMTWALEPHPAGVNPGPPPTFNISMWATIASDDSGGIRYEFEFNDGNISTSGWRDDPNYTKVVTDPTGPYCFRVRAQDAFYNETGWSAQVCVSNLGDAIPPAPAPTIIWVTGGWQILDPLGDYSYSGEFTTATGTVRWWHRVVADVTGITDDSGGPLEVRFICDDSQNNGFSSTKKVGQPIIIDEPPNDNVLGGHTATDTYQVFWTGNTIVYDVCISPCPSLGEKHIWTVCVYDPTQNPACSDPVEIAPIYIGRKREQ